METIMLRPLDPRSDFPRMAEIMNAIQSESVDVAGLKDWYRRSEAPERVQQNTVALDAEGRFVGFAHVWRDAWKVAGKFGVEVAVDPARCKRGVGTQLYIDALTFAQQHGATHFEAVIRDHMPEALHFAQARGFEIDRHLFESTLDLVGFDETRFAGVIEKVEASGIRFTNLAELGETLEAKRQLYELNRRSSLSIPGHEQSYRPFEQFQRDVFESSWYRADGQIAALDGARWIGMSAIGYFPATRSTYNMITGVDQEYRGRRIALALKLLAIRCARRYGATLMRTNNDSENAPMLALNRRLGYQSQPGKYLIIKHLT